MKLIERVQYLNRCVKDAISGTNSDIFNQLAKSQNSRRRITPFQQNGVRSKASLPVDTNCTVATTNQPVADVNQSVTNSNVLAATDKEILSDDSNLAVGKKPVVKKRDEKSTRANVEKVASQELQNVENVTLSKERQKGGDRMLALVDVFSDQDATSKLPHVRQRAKKRTNVAQEKRETSRNRPTKSQTCTIMAWQQKLRRPRPIK